MFIPSIVYYTISIKIEEMFIMYDANEKIHVNDFRTLKVWQRAVALSKEIYKIVGGFPRFEEYGMKSQIIRCSTSISANISEGNSQLYPKKEYNFANNALGSAGETKHWLEMAYELNYIDNDI